LFAYNFGAISEEFDEIISSESENYMQTNDIDKI